jgi:hypothetical protein
MNTREINRGIRKSWGDTNPVERVHKVRNEKGSSRQALRRQMMEEMEGFDGDDDVGFPIRLKGGKKHTAMQALKRDKGTSVIPKGCYCYDKNGNCPYWDAMSDKPSQMNGWCWFLEKGDWTGETLGLLWDQCKSCNINDDDTEWEEYIGKDDFHK